MKKLVALVFILSSVIAQAQHKETRKVGSFKGVAVSSSIEATYVHSNRNEVVLDAEDADHLKKLETVVEGGVLVIGYRSNSNIRTRRANRVTIYSTSSSLQRIKVTSSASLRVEAPLKASKISIDVNSSGKLFVADLVTEVAELDASSSGRFDAKITADALTVEASSSAKLNLMGSAKSATIDISSSAQVNMAEFKIKNAVVDASSSAQATVQVSDKLVADASSSGKITYIGKPASVQTDKSSGGQVTAR
ncbi:head GIN domain-containing protein [Sphingobacterium bambusae]|uniref:Head GIN domain-containing protein n=1 Tax=Sphingobacterium bambusae TaxID=662858 RepID=A0ABW6BP75_9SPHI|nr:head GIN domain-containing protein [Sphingobacterium bambusae]WPL48223.1 head GIN domain-containing protein [Sphingobacterium bambusae]